MSRIIVRQAIYADLEALTEWFDQCRVFQGKESDVSAARSFLRAPFDHGESVLFIAHQGAAPQP